MRKIICTILALLLALSLAACNAGEAGNGGATNPYYSPEEGVVRLDQLKSDMLADLDLTDALELDGDALQSLYGIQPEDVADAACFVTLDGVFPQEVIMIRAADADAAGRVETCLQTRLEEFRVQSQNYDAENYAIAQKCSILTDGTYVAMFLTPDYEAMSAMFQAAMKR